MSNSKAELFAENRRLNDEIKKLKKTIECLSKALHDLADEFDKRTGIK